MLPAVEERSRDLLHTCECLHEVSIGIRRRILRFSPGLKDEIGAARRDDITRASAILLAREPADVVLVPVCCYHGMQLSPALLLDVFGDSLHES